MTKESVGDTNATNAASTEISATLAYGDFALEIANLSEQAKAYLMQYGFAKSMQDSVAGAKARLTAELNEDGSLRYNETEVAVILHDTQAKRLDAIVNGTIGARSGTPRATPLEKVLKQIATEAIRAAARAKNFSLKKAPMDELVAKWLAKHEAAANAEAERRMATIDTNTDDLFEGLDEA